MTPASGPRPWLVFTATSIGVVVSSLNASMTAVALPSMVADLSATPFAANWVLLTYMIVTTVLILAFGRLSDLLGRRRVYLAGLALFMLSSVACGMAPDVAVLIGARIAQGIGAAAIITNATALLVDVFPHETLKIALGYNLAVSSAANALGPVLAGLVLHALDWRWIFLLLAPVTALGVAWAPFVVPAVNGRGRGVRSVLQSTPLLFVCLGGLILSVSFTSMPASAWWWSGLAAAGGLLGAVAFVVVQRRSKSPILDLGILAHRGRATGYAANFLMSTNRVTVVVLASLYVQAARGGDALEAGSSVFWYAVGLMAGAVVSGWLTRLASARVIATTGCAVCASGLAVLLIDPGSGNWALAVGLGLIGSGNGIFMTPNTAEIMMSVGENQRGVANGLRSMLQNTGQALGTACALAILTAGLSAVGSQAVYAGQLGTVAAQELGAFDAGYRASIAMLIALAIAAGVFSAARGADHDSTKRRRQAHETRPVDLVGR